MTTKTHRRGFSLAEFAIVMGIIGIIIGGIWAYATTSWQRLRAEQLEEAINTTAANVRATFSGQSGIPQITPSYLMPILINQNVVPSTLIRPTALNNCTNTPAQCADTPWGPNDGGIPTGGGTFTACAWDIVNTACSIGTATSDPTSVPKSQLFAIVAHGLSIDACMKVAIDNSQATSPTGLLDININGCNMISGTGTCNGPGPTAKMFPLAATDASTFCNLTSNNNAVSFIYKLRI